MKKKLFQVTKDLAQDKITEGEARILLLGLLGVSNSMGLKKPTPEKYGWYNQQGYNDEPPSGWVFEGSEQAYYEALKKWEKQQTVIQQCNNCIHLRAYTGSQEPDDPPCVTCIKGVFNYLHPKCKWDDKECELKEIDR